MYKKREPEDICHIKGRRVSNKKKKKKKKKKIKS